MLAHVVTPAELTAADRDHWRELQRADPALASPFLAPEFTAIVGRARDDVNVAILECDGQVAGYFPFQRGRLGAGRALGLGLSDHQAVIAAPPLRWSARELLRACELKTFEFDHLVAGQAPFAPFHRRRRTSPLMDLSDGFEAYAAGRRAAGVRELRSTERKRRKLERERGALSFTVHDPDPAVLKTALAWKSAQYVRTGAGDVLAAPWVRSVLEAIHAQRSPAFAGMLSVLRVDGRPVALHVGMRSETVWHWWFPVYDASLSAYSPGLILLVEMAAAAPSLGLKSIDLGKGEARYKESLASGDLEVAEGAVATPSVAAAAAAARRAVRRVARASGLGAPLRRALRRG